MFRGAEQIALGRRHWGRLSLPFAFPDVKDQAPEHQPVPGNHLRQPRINVLLDTKTRIWDVSPSSRTASC